MCLRNLVDLERLSRGDHQGNLGRLRRLRMVRWSSHIAHELTGAEAFSGLFEHSELGSRRARQHAQLAQTRPWRSQGEGPWKPQQSLSVITRMLPLSLNGEDWLRIVLYYTLLPAAFSDPETGEDRGLISMIKARWRRLRQRARESQQPNPTASA